MNDDYFNSVPRLTEEEIKRRCTGDGIDLQKAHYFVWNYNYYAKYKTWSNETKAEQIGISLKLFEHFSKKILSEYWLIRILQYFYRGYSTEFIMDMCNIPNEEILSEILLIFGWRLQEWI